MAELLLNNFHAVFSRSMNTIQAGFLKQAQGAPTFPRIQRDLRIDGIPRGAKDKHGEIIKAEF